MSSTDEAEPDPDRELGDWRIAAAARLAQDLPAAYSGGPAHKAGTPVYQSTLVKTKQEELLGFTAPSAVAMALNIALRASDEAKKLFPRVGFQRALTPDGWGRTAVSADCPTLYDFFEQCMISAVFSFQALEAFCNQTIVRELKEPMQVKRRDGLISLSPIEIERMLSTNEKLAVVIPRLRSLPTPKGKAVWESFKKLQEARDETVHLKAADQYGNDKESLFFQFLSHQAAEFPKASVEMIRYFHPVRRTWPRWLHLVLL